MQDDQPFDYQDQSDENTPLQAAGFKKDPTVEYACVRFDGIGKQVLPSNIHVFSEDRGRKRRRGTRWGTGQDLVTPSTLSQIPKYIPGGMTTEQQEAMLGTH